MNTSFNRNAANADTDLIEVTEHHQNLLEQMVGRDWVHDFGAQSLEALLEYRVAGQGFTKTAYALVSDQGTYLRSVIFGYKVAAPIRSSMDLPGNVASILSFKSHEAMDATPSAIVFYSISSFAKGAGPMLVESLLASSNGTTLSVTLSPLRTLAAAFPSLDAQSLSGAEKTALACLHLMTITNGVQKFHMGNGARIGNIHVDANTPESLDGVEGLGVMVNYTYPSNTAERRANQALFKTIAGGEEKPHRLLELIDPDLRARLASMPAIVEKTARATGHGPAVTRLICG